MMLELIAKRLLAGVVTLFAASIVFFVATEIQPGDFAIARLGRFATPDNVEMVRESYGLYRPVHVRYLDWLSHLFEGKFGYSWANRREIGSIVSWRIANTLFLAAVTAFIAVPLAIGLGLLAAMRHNTMLDRIISATAIATFLVPDFVIALILVFLLAITLPLFPSIAVLIEPATIWHALYIVSLPVLTLCLVMMPSIIRLTRAAVINVRARPFIEMAILKGLPKWRIFVHHAFPHAVGPIMNAVILGIANLLVGVVIVEIVFAFPGIGQLMVDAVRMRDVPVVQACGLIFTVTYILLTLVADIIAIISNPRLATQKTLRVKLIYGKEKKRMKVKRVVAIATSIGILSVGFFFVRDYLRGYRLQQIDTEYISDVETTLTVAPREQITASDLFADSYQGVSPVNNAYFMPPDNASPALHGFSGTLVIAATKMSGRRVGATMIRNFGSFPALKVNFFTFQNHLVPIERNILLAGEGSAWSIILGSGRIWSDPGDKGYSRASFPFTLVGSRWGQTHNGIAIFLFNQKHVSALRFQIVQEAAPQAKFDAWGQAQMKYLPSPLPGQAALIRDFEKELALQTPIHAWKELEQNYDPKMLDRIDFTSNRKNITLSGLIIDDVVYARACRTRYGDYPYRDQMRHAVYSISKSLGTLVAMLRLAQKYGDEIFDLRITDYVAIDSDHDGWKDVTFGDTLNMATGIADAEPRRVSNYVEESASALASRVSEAHTTKEKLNIIASFRNYAWGPGEVFRYRDADTFVLAVAMDRFIKREEGPGADIWTLMLKEVFEPIGITHLPTLRTREPKGGRGVPLFAYGMMPNLDEVAKLAKLLSHGGRHRGEQILSASKLAEALGPSMKIGLPTGWRIVDGETNYHMSFWQHPYRAQKGCLLRIPAMSGHGGNYVIIMPNGITGFRFADGRYSSPGTWDSSGLRKVADYIRPFCKKSIK